MVLAVPGRAQAWAQTAAIVPEPREAEEASVMAAETIEVSAAKAEGRPLSWRAFRLDEPIQMPG